MQYVVAHRTVAEQYWHKPWSEVVAAAKAGDTGLRVSDSVPAFRPREADPASNEQGAWRYVDGWDDWDDICFLREGKESEGWVGGDRTLLRQQNWGG